MLLNGKKGIILGVANNMSIAYAIAKFAKEQGAKLALTYPNETLAKRVIPIADELNCDFVENCDVTKVESIENLVNLTKTQWENIDFIVHAVAFADKNELKGRYINTTLENFQLAMHVSCYSLTALAQKFEPIMNDNSSILTLSYLGANKVIPNYNVMGLAKAALECSVKYLANDMGSKVRVNAISAGPIKTLAASGISDFRAMLQSHLQISPLKRNITQEDVAKSAIYLLSDYSSGVTGEIHYVDGGYNIIGSAVAE